MSTPEHLLPPPPACPCVVLIGMAGAGKSTVGMALAQTLGWAFMDSDYLMEALYADRLQSVTDALSKEAFLDLEAVVLGSIRVQRTVIATGGSAVYRPQAMAHLATLGPVVFLDVPLETIEERIARNPDRGLAIAPGQTLADIFYEREALYNHYATLRCDGLRLSGRRLFLCPFPMTGMAHCAPACRQRPPRVDDTFRLTFFRTHVSDVSSVNRHFYLQ